MNVNLMVISTDKILTVKRQAKEGFTKLTLVTKVALKSVLSYTHWLQEYCEALIGRLVFTS